MLLLIYHWFTRDLFGENEDLWEGKQQSRVIGSAIIHFSTLGAFSLAASVMMLPMSLGMLRLEKSKAKWQYTFNQAMSNKSGMATRINSVLFALPLVTVLREGVEGLIFVGGVRSLHWPAVSRTHRAQICCTGLIGRAHVFNTFGRSGWSGLRLRCWRLLLPDSQVS